MISLVITSLGSGFDHVFGAMRVIRFVMTNCSTLLI